MPRLDIVIGIVALITSIAVFFAQGPYKQPWSYVLALAPIAFALLFIILHWVLRKYKALGQALAHAKREYDYVTGTHTTSDLVVRVNNDKGDISYERKFRIVVIRDGVTIDKTNLDLLSCEAKVDGIPPKASVLRASKDSVSLEAIEVASEELSHGGRRHVDHRWRYKISPPLVGKGQFVEYQYSADIPGSELTAFSEEGSLFFFLHEAVLMDSNCSLVSPSHYRISILEAYVQQYDGQRLDSIPPEEAPKLEANDHVLRWKPVYRKGASFVCRYRLLSKWAINLTAQQRHFASCWAAGYCRR
jgi:hypothetical protein